MLRSGCGACGYLHIGVMFVVMSEDVSIDGTFVPSGVDYFRTSEAPIYSFFMIQECEKLSV